MAIDRGVSFRMNDGPGSRAGDERVRKEEIPMSGTRWPMLCCLALATVVLTGCQTGPSKQTLAAAEPALSPPVEGGTTIVQAPAPRTVTFVERHPCFTSHVIIMRARGAMPL